MTKRNKHVSDDYPHTELLMPGEVAEIFGVHPKTVSRWAAAGELAYIKTAGGHRRFPRWSVEELEQKIAQKETMVLRRRIAREEREDG